MQNNLEVKQLCKRYDGFALKNISFSLPAGCILGVIGENGAGKSTTIKAILDIIHKDSGDITILGQPQTTVNKEHIGVVLDESSFPENLTGSQINRIMGKLYQTWDSHRFFDYLRRFQLAENKMVKEYSRGMKMKLGFAAALSHDSKLLLLDEATSGLDPLVRDELLDELLSFIQDESHSVLLSSHITSDLEKVCDYIAYIHQGQLLFMEPKDALLENYGILKCDRSTLDSLAEGAVAGAKFSAFGVEALVLREKLPANFHAEKPTLEDIMLYFGRGND